MWRELHGATLMGGAGGGGHQRPADRACRRARTSKSFAQLDTVLDELIGHGAERDDLIIAFGGGVVGDLTGLAAGLLKRGARFVQIPTTLLAQVDSSVGGKTAINRRAGKNMVGLFHQPVLVLADLDVLDTLPARERSAGLAEIAKYALIDDPAFFDFLEANAAALRAGDKAALAEAVRVSCASKARIVAIDETEQAERALLNLGHTFGHALERANDFRPEPAARRGRRRRHGDGAALFGAARRLSGTGRRAGRAPAECAGAGDAHGAISAGGPYRRGRTAGAHGARQESQERPADPDSRARDRAGLHPARCRHGAAAGIPAKSETRRFLNRS